MTVNLEQEEWNRVLAVLSQGPWNIVNPLIMTIGSQLKEAQDARSNSGEHHGNAGEEFNRTEIRTPDRH